MVFKCGACTTFLNWTGEDSSNLFSAWQKHKLVHLWFMFVYLFICVLLNNTVSISDCIFYWGMIKVLLLNFVICSPRGVITFEPEISFIWSATRFYVITYFWLSTKWYIYIFWRNFLCYSIVSLEKYFLLFYRRSS